MTLLHRVYAILSIRPWVPFLFLIPMLVMPFFKNFLMNVGLWIYSVTAVAVILNFFRYNQKKDEALIAQARDHFAKVFNSKTICIAINTLYEGKFININDEFLNILGYNKDDVIGKTTRQLDLFANDQGRKSVIKSLKDIGFVKNLDLSLLTKNKTVLHVSLSADIIQYQHTSCVLSVLIDISDRKYLDDELKKAMFTTSQMTADAEIKNYQLEMEMHQRNHAEKVNQVLYDISNAVNTTRNLDDLYASIHKILGTIMTLNNFFIAIYNKHKDRVSFPYSRDLKDSIVTDINNVSKKDSLTIEVIKTQKPLLLKKEELSGNQEAPERNVMGTPSKIWLGVPLKIEGEVIGVMATQSYTDPDRFSEKDIHLMETVSDQIALAIERKKSQEALLLSEIKHRSIIEGIKDGYCETDMEGRIIFFNEALCSITGHPEVSLSGLPFTNFLGDVGDLDMFLKQLLKNKDKETDFQIVQENGIKKHIGIRPTPVFDEDGQQTGFRTFVRDIDAQKRYEKKLVFLAYHDALTGLNNRKGFYEFLDITLKTAKRNQTRLAVLFMDIDKFKQVNDTLGHEIGDALLVTISQRLKDNLRETDFISRIGGDEFTVVMTNSTSFHPERLARKIQKTLSSPYELNDQVVDYVSASIGISIFPDDEDGDIEALVKKADQAMYEAKKTRNSHIFYKDISR